MTFCAGMACEDFKSDGEEGVACQHGDAFPKYFVVGGTTAPEVVIVHAGEVIMDQRVGMDALDGCGGWESVGYAAATGFGGRDTGDWTESFAACEQAIAHGLVDGGWLGRSFGNPLV